MSRRASDSTEGSSGIVVTKVPWFIRIITVLVRLSPAPVIRLKLPVILSAQEAAVILSHQVL
jgi:hypothetical protein